MSTAPTVIENLLDPISADQPAGADLRWTPDWDRIKEARRADDDLDTGKWAKKERKSANWTQVKQLCETALRHQTKDLQIAMWLTEADIKISGFPGLRDSLRLLRELLERYWDHGLYPPIEDGPEDRVGPLEWFNEKLIDSVLALPITVRSDGGQDYSLVDLQDSRRVGSEAGCRNADGDIDPVKKREYDAALAQGHISAEMFERAVEKTRRADYESFRAVFVEVLDEFKALEKVIDEKFGDAGPNMAACRGGLTSLDVEISDILEKRRRAEPEEIMTGSAGADGGVSTTANRGGEQIVLRLPVGLPDALSTSGSDRVSWQEAEMLIKSGQVDRGLAEMTRLAAHETCGRDRFQRRLLLAEICLASNRERLARSILEELSSQIDKHQLEQWESSELIAAVWTRLHQLYRRSEADSGRAGTLYERLCKLDPWQALKCNEG